MSNHGSSHTLLTSGSITPFLHQCILTKNLLAIKRFHAHLFRTGLFFFSPILQTKLVFTYTACPDKNNNVRTLTNLLKCINLRNPLPFNAIISHFCGNMLLCLALRTFSFMHANRVPIDSYALCSSLTASSCSQTVAFGKQIHAHVEKLGWLSSVFVGCALIDLYAKSLLINDAALLFDEIPVKNIVCVNALLSGYAEAKMWIEGLKLFRKMPWLNLNSDNLTLTAALRACTGLSAIELGKQIHAHVVRMVPDAGADAFLQSMLIEMYGKCGLVEKARLVFNTAGYGTEAERKRDVVLWTSVLNVYGRNGKFKELIGLFEEMLTEGIKPDGVAFLTVISACCHTGQVNLGIEYFESMVCDFGLNPSHEHNSCLVDLLCRAGELDKAWKLVNDLQCKGNGSCTVSMWGSLLSACNDCGNVDLGRLAAQSALELDPQNVGIFVLLSNMYAKHGMWNEIQQLRDLMKERGLRKDVGCSWLETTT